MKIRFPLLAGALLAALPLALLVPGCGGGGGGSSDATATPVANPTATATAMPLPTDAPTPTATATATPRPTATPVGTAMPVNGTLATINLSTAVGDSDTVVNHYKTAIRGTQTVTKTDTAFTLSSLLPGGTRRTFTFSLNGSAPLQTGQSFTVGGNAPTASVDVSVRYSGRGDLGGGGPSEYSYPGTSGKITLTALSATSLTVRFDNVILRGPLTLNGTVVSKLP